MATKTSLKMIQDKLENQIHNLIMETGRKPKLIVMNPQTWVELAKEVTGKDGISINRYDPNMKYRGIKVLRSLDLLEGEFQMVSVSQQRELFDAILDFTEDLPMCSEDYNRDTLYKRYIAENCG